MFEICGKWIQQIYLSTNWKKTRFATNTSNDVILFHFRRLIDFHFIEFIYTFTSHTDSNHLNSNFDDKKALGGLFSDSTFFIKISCRLIRLKLNSIQFVTKTTRNSLLYKLFCCLSLFRWPLFYANHFGPHGPVGRFFAFFYNVNLIMYSYFDVCTFFRHDKEIKMKEGRSM